MKHWFTALSIAAAALLLAQCVKPELNSANQLLTTPDLTEINFLDDAFKQARMNNEFAQTNLFIGTQPQDPFLSSFQSNELSLLDNATIALGRVLFYDPRLSINNDVSCGSCHNATLSFSEPREKSIGVVGVKTDRNAMAICNLAFNSGHFWRNEEVPLEQTLLGPVTQHIEMGTSDLDALSKELVATDYYPALFQKAFGTSDVSPDRIRRAMTHFLGRLISLDAPLDRDVLTPQQIHGQAVFNANCSTCHTVSAQSMSVSSGYGGDSDGLNFSDDVSSNGGGNTLKVSNIGLDLHDPIAARAGGFKIPGLRNIEVTGPYMHDGRFKTLDEVIDHYSTGIKLNPNLDKRLINTDGSAKNMNFTPYDKAALKAFLGALTDPTFLNDARFANPFN
jgi:cytochrome c peroxidase